MLIDLVMCTTLLQVALQEDKLRQSVMLLRKRLAGAVVDFLPQRVFGCFVMHNLDQVRGKPTVVQFVICVLFEVLNFHRWQL